jgi:hypothetical protein
MRRCCYVYLDLCAENSGNKITHIIILTALWDW